MDYIVPSENEYGDLNIPISEETSPYDAAYPIMLLSNGLKSRLAQAQNVQMKCMKLLFKKLLHLHKYNSH